MVCRKQKLCAPTEMASPQEVFSPLGGHDWDWGVWKLPSWSSITEVNKGVSRQEDPFSGPLVFTELASLPGGALLLITSSYCCWSPGGHEGREVL